jgi:hypothetical protein
MLRVVALWATAYAPGLPVAKLSIHFHGMAEPVVLPVPPPGLSALTAAPPADESPERLTDLQERILDALAGKALRTDALAHKADCDRGQMFRKGGLKELRECGLVAHHKDHGFYRPDDPPPDGPGER